MAILVLNGGSSSWKSALFRDMAPDATPHDAATLAPAAAVALAWHGSTEPARLEGQTRDGRTLARDVRVERGGAAVAVLLDAYRELGCDPATFGTVGHRIVHGGARFDRSVRIDDGVMSALRALEPFAPSHNPIEVAGIEAIARALPGVAQVAAFDTVFHRSLPQRAYVYGGPYDWLARDIRRYGFHGLSVAYCIERAGCVLGRRPADVRCVVAHLGGGCSVSAVRDGRSVATSMGFTPLDGVVMGTRSGAVDPGILVYLLRDEPEQSAAEAARRIDATLNREAGLLGLSGVSGDVRDVLTAAAGGNVRAELALDVFAYRIATAIAATLPALERIDALVFTGGIGEHAGAVRARICEHLAFAGIALDARSNDARGDADDCDIARDDSRARVLAITAREEWYVARECARVVA